MKKQQVILLSLTVLLNLCAINSSNAAYRYDTARDAKSADAPVVDRLTIDVRSSYTRHRVTMEKLFAEKLSVEPFVLGVARVYLLTFFGFDCDVERVYSQDELDAAYEAICAKPLGAGALEEKRYKYLCDHLAELNAANAPDQFSVFGDLDL